MLLLILPNTRLSISLGISAIVFFLAALLVSTALASQTLTVSLVHQFPPIHWVENIGIRPNGNIIAIFSVGTGAQLSQIDPLTTEVSLIHDFSNAGNSIQYIVEVQEDFFVI